ncbi:hypothetical protein [Bradyrhizobium sp.]|uniref:hypothetical protein n=1 Tax=Bradyrhizobium sp. TaxID=376 RepID=UPI003C6242D4
MSVLHFSDDRRPGLPGERRLTLRRTLRRLWTAVGMIHQAIVTARLRRFEEEFMLRARYGEEQSSDHDASNFPQRPLVLGDKWDF